MAYLSPEQITGQVIFNTYAKNGCVINSTDHESSINTDDILNKQWSITADPKFHKYSYSSDTIIRLKTSMESDFTYCGWVKRDHLENYIQLKLGTYDYFYGRANYYTSGFFYNSSLKRASVISTDPNIQNPSFDPNNLSSVPFNIDEWNFLALTKKDNVLYWFVNGKLVKTFSMPASYIPLFYADHENFEVCIESYYTSNESVVIKNQALWTEDFEVPTDVLIGEQKYNYILWKDSKLDNKMKLY